MFNMTYVQYSENQNIPHFGTFPKSNKKIVKRGKFDYIIYIDYINKKWQG